MFRILRAVGLAFALALSFPAFGQTLEFSWSQNVGPLNPHAYSPNQMFAQAMVYEPLVKYQADGTLAPWLAESWQVSDDGRTYIFKLRSGVTFSNGEPFDAVAVKKNFQTVLANRANHEWLGLVNQLESVEEVDPGSVAFVLKAPYYPFLQEMALVRPVRFLAPAGFPASGSTAEGIAAPIGTGPWVLKESVLGQYDVFERNEKYWGEKPAFEKIVVKVIADPNTRAIALETGEIDMIYGVGGQITPDAFKRFVDNGFQTGVSTPYETSAIAMNSSKSPTDELAVRQAINHAVNKDNLVTGIYYDTQKRADTLFAPEVPYADIGLQPYAFDPARASALLDQAGWKLATGETVRTRDGAPLTLELHYRAPDAAMKLVAETIQGDLAVIGIAVSLVGEEDSAFYARQNDGNFQMIFNGSWGAPYDPHAFVSGMRVPSHADFQAQSGLADKAKIDEAITAALDSTDETERQAKYDYVLRTLHEQAVYLPLTYLTAISVLGPEVTGTAFGATAYEFPFEALKPAQ